MDIITEKQTILIVDDEKTNRNVLRELLSPIANIKLAKDGEQALSKVLQHKPDLVLLDVIMPKLDGFQVLETMQTDPSTKEVPVIFITGLNDNQGEEAGLSLGARDYVSKPFHPAIVMARVKTQLELRLKEKQLKALANTDILTGINNRRRFEYLFQKEWNRCWRSQSPLSLLIMDIDNFKAYNDTLGHPAGDQTLTAVAQTINETAKRPGDFAARYGGEEFVVVLPESDKSAAINVAQQICENIRNLNIEHPSSVSDVVTLSIGGSTTIPDNDYTHNLMISQADERLYQAKKEGRNRFICE